MKLNIFFIAVAAVLLSLTVTPLSVTDPLPEFTSDAPEHWINSKPLTTGQLKGKVLLVEVWTSV